MLRFILSFIFFGVLFYLIWKYFPEAFETLFSWLESGINYIKSFFTGHEADGMGTQIHKS